MTPPTTPEHTSEGGRDDLGVPCLRRSTSLASVPPRARQRVYVCREGWEDGTPPPHRDFKERGVGDTRLKILLQDELGATAAAQGPATKPLRLMVGCANGNCPGCRIKRDPHSSKEADCSGDGFDHYEE